MQPGFQFINACGLFGGLMAAFIIAEFVARDSRLQLRSLNHVHGDIINPQWPVAESLMI